MILIPKNRYLPNRKIYIFDHIPYWKDGYYGCQLKSLEWFPAKIGEIRVLSFFDGSKMEFVPFHQKRTWSLFRWEISWTLGRVCMSQKELEEKIALLHSKLKETT